MEEPETKLTMCLYQNNIEHPSQIQGQGEEQTQAVIMNWYEAKSE